MAIRGTEVTSTLSKGGQTQNNLDTLRDSRLHNEYSINGIPNVKGQPNPSQLDLDGIRPGNLGYGPDKTDPSTSLLDKENIIRYVDNLPT